MKTKTLIACLATGLLTLGQAARAAANPATAPSHTASFESRHHARQTHRPTTLSEQNISGVDSACDPWWQSTTDAQSVRAGEIRNGGRERLARSRGPRKRERNQPLQYFFLATVPLSPNEWPC